MQSLCDDFNQKYKEGDAVNVRTDNGETVVDTIKYKASVLGGRGAMVWLENLGCHNLERVVGHYVGPLPKTAEETLPVTVWVKPSDIELLKACEFDDMGMMTGCKRPNPRFESFESMVVAGLMYHPYQLGEGAYYLTDLGKQILGA